MRPATLHQADATGLVVLVEDQLQPFVEIGERLHTDRVAYSSRYSITPRGMQAFDHAGTATPFRTWALGPWAQHLARHMLLSGVHELPTGGWRDALPALAQTAAATIAHDMPTHLA